MRFELGGRETLNQQLQESEGRLRTLCRPSLEHLVQERTEELTHSEHSAYFGKIESNLTEQRERKQLATELHDYLAQLLVLGREFPRPRPSGSVCRLAQKTWSSRRRRSWPGPDLLPDLDGRAESTDTGFRRDLPGWPTTCSGTSWRWPLMWSKRNDFPIPQDRAVLLSSGNC